MRVSGVSQIYGGGVTKASHFEKTSETQYLCGFKHPAQMAQIYSTSIEEIKKRNEMNVHLVGNRIWVYGVDFICAVCATLRNLVFMRVSAYFAFCDAFCDASKNFVTPHET